MNPFIQSKVMTAEDVANRMPLQGTIATSGFTPAGYPKVIPKAYAARIEKEKLAGKNPWFNLYKTSRNRAGAHSTRPVRTIVLVFAARS